MKRKKGGSKLSCSRKCDECDGIPYPIKKSKLNGEIIKWCYCDFFTKKEGKGEKSFRPLLNVYQSFKLKRKDPLTGEETRPRLYTESIETLNKKDRECLQFEEKEDREDGKIF